MEIHEITFRNRNDFHWKGRCENCEHIERYGDGYADAFYCQEVVPNRECEKCGLTTVEIHWMKINEIYLLRID